MRKSYLAFNSYGNGCSIGFSNTWRVLVFKSKKTRDKYVDENERYNISIRAIKKSNICKYVVKPKPFSGQRRAIDPGIVYDCNFNNAIGLIGEVVCDYSQAHYDTLN